MPCGLTTDGLDVGSADRTLDGHEDVDVGKALDSGGAPITSDLCSRVATPYPVETLRLARLQSLAQGDMFLGTPVISGNRREAA